LHTRQQTIAMMDNQTGELVEKELQHEGDQVRAFYSSLPKPVLVGLEATGSMHWFLRLLEELGGWVTQFLSSPMIRRTMTNQSSCQLPERKIRGCPTLSGLVFERVGYSAPFASSASPTPFPPPVTNHQFTPSRFREGSHNSPRTASSTPLFSFSYAPIRTLVPSMDGGIYNVRKAICGYFCQTCYGVIGADIFYAPFAVAVGGTTQETFYEQWNTGGQTSPSATWSSSARSIATVNNSGVVSGVSVGSVTVSAEDDFTETIGIDNYCSLDPYCPTEYPAGSGPGTVRVLYAAELISTIFSRVNAACPAGQAGWDRGITEKIVDQSGQYWTYDGILIQEAITIGRNDFNLSCGQNNNSCNGSENTYSSGTFDDRFYFCSPACVNPTNSETDATQVLYYNGVPVQLTNLLVYKCGSISWNGQ